MKISEIANGQFSIGRKNNCKGMTCCPKPKFNNKTSYGSLLVENAIKELALREASRIIAQDIYMKSK